MIDDDGGRPRQDAHHAAQQGAGPGPNTPSGEQPVPTPPPETPRHRPLPALLLGATVAIVAVVLATARTTGPQPGPAPLGDAAGTTAANEAVDVLDVVAPRSVSAEELARLPQATTFGVTPTAPYDPAPDRVPGGKVVHPAQVVPVFAAPGGEPVAAVPPQQPLGTPPHQIDSDTWLPVLDEQPGWALVGLPSRPNGSTAWLHLDTDAVTVSRTPNVIMVDLARYELTLTSSGREVGRWTVGIGKPGSATPTGRTFLLAALRDPQPNFSQYVLPLGAHSDTHQSYGGGPGTVGVHTWPTAEVYGTASSDGCIRVPPDALDVLTTVPLGTAVLIK